MTGTDRVLHLTTHFMHTCSHHTDMSTISTTPRTYVVQQRAFRFLVGSLLAELFTRVFLSVSRVSVSRRQDALIARNTHTPWWSLPRPFSSKRRAGTTMLQQVSTSKEQERELENNGYKVVDANVNAGTMGPPIHVW